MIVLVAARTPQRLRGVSAKRRPPSRPFPRPAPPAAAAAAAAEATAVWPFGSTDMMLRRGTAQWGLGNTDGEVEVEGKISVCLVSARRDTMRFVTAECGRGRFMGELCVRFFLSTQFQFHFQISNQATQQTPPTQPTP